MTGSIQILQTKDVISLFKLQVLAYEVIKIKMENLNDHRVINI